MSEWELYMKASCLAEMILLLMLSDPVDLDSSVRIDINIDPPSLH